MLRGLKTKWKQVITWHVCPKNNDADRLYQFFQELLIKVEGIGLKVRGILSDMGPKNLALWRHYGIKVNRITASHFIDHPVRKEEKLYFMADVPHLLKNIKSMFITHEITVSEDVVLKHNLPSHLVKSAYVKKCIEIQDRHQLKLPPNLNMSKLEPINNFDKMNVGFACDVFNNQKMFRFIIPSRFNQDCLESLFSSLRRHGNNDPNALQAMRSLRIMTMSQFIDNRKETFNYTKDDDEHYVNLFTDKREKKKALQEEIEQCVKPEINFESQKDRSDDNLNLVERNSLSNFVGAAICKVLQKHRSVICRSCTSQMKSSKNSEVQNIFISCLEKKNLVYPDSLFFSLMITIDNIINVEIESCHTHPIYYIIYCTFVNQI